MDCAHSLDLTGSPKLGLQISGQIGEDTLEGSEKDCMGEEDEELIEDVDEEECMEEEEEEECNEEEEEEECVEEEEEEEFMEEGEEEFTSSVAIATSNRFVVLASDLEDASIGKHEEIINDVAQDEALEVIRGIEIPLMSHKCNEEEGEFGDELDDLDANPYEFHPIDQCESCRKMNPDTCCDFCTWMVPISN